MSNFERRLSSLNRRPTIDPATDVKVGSVPPAGASLGWEAAERLAHLVDVSPGTVIRLSVDDGTGLAMFEVAWDETGVPSIRET